MISPRAPSRTPRICVIIPTYNRAAVLPEAIESVLAQRYQDFRILIVDDGSTDDTKAIVSQRFANLPRVSYMRQENAGPARSRNVAIRTSRSEFIAFLDSDDLWDPDKLQAQVLQMENNPGAGLSFTDAVLRDDEKGDRTLFVDHRFTGDTTLHGLARAGFPIHTSCVMVRRDGVDSLGGFDESFTFREDTDLWTRVIAAGSAVCLNRSLTIVRIHGDNMSRTRNLEQWSCSARFWDKNRKLLKRSGCPAGLIRTSSAHLHWKLAGRLRSMKKYRLARTHYLQAFTRRPERPTAFLWWVVLSLRGRGSA